MPQYTVNEAALTGFTHYAVFKHTDFDGDSAAGGIVKEFSVPAGSLLTDVAVHKVTNFTGGSISDCRLDIGYGGDGAGTIDDFIDDADIFDGDEYVHNTGAELVVNEGGSDTTETATFLFSSADTIDIEFTPTGDTMKNATAGEVVVKFKILSLSQDSELN